MKGTVGQRTAVGYAVILVLLVVVAGVGMYALPRTTATFEGAVRQQEQSLEALRADERITAANVNFLRYLLIGDPRFVKTMEDRLSTSRQIMTALRDASTTPELKSGWEEALSLLTLQEEGYKAAVSAKAARREAEALRIHAEVQPVRERLIVLVDRLVASDRARAKEATQSAVAAASRAFWVIVIVGGFALLSGVLISWGLTRSITGPLRLTIGTLASACSEILAATTQQASGTAEEATAVQETSTTVDEVKALAEQSKQATAQVRGILNEIQRATQAAVMAAEQGVKASEAGVGVATRAGEAIGLLSESLTESAQAAQQIMVSTQQQVAGVDQVAVAMQNIQRASTQNMASTRQVERAAQDLNELAGRLKALVAASGNERRRG